MVDFTRHAKNNLRLYRISQEDAIAVVTSPDTTTRDADGKAMAWKTLSGRLLRAVYVVEGEKIVVVTIHPKD